MTIVLRDPVGDTFQQLLDSCCNCQGDKKQEACHITQPADTEVWLTLDYRQAAAQACHTAWWCLRITLQQETVKLLSHKAVKSLFFAVPEIPNTISSLQRPPSLINKLVC